MADGDDDVKGQEGNKACETRTTGRVTREARSGKRVSER